MDSEPIGFSANEFRIRLCENLKSQGFVDLVKSRIRTKLIMELNRDGGKLFMGKDLKKGGSSLAQKAVDSLVAHHLISNNYDYTLSIFVPESGLDQKNILSVKDILRVLNISSETAGDCKNDGLLHGIIKKFLSRTHNFSNIETQTDEHHLSLEAKLQQVESFYRRLEGQDGMSWNNQERLELMKHKVEEKLKSEMELKLLKFKKKELFVLQKEERDRYRQDMDKYKQEVDRIYQDRLQSIIKREQNLNATSKEKEISLEKETFRQRQMLLEEMNRLKEREESVKKKEDEIQRDKKMMEDKFCSFEEMMKRRENEVEEARKEVESRVWSEIQRYKLEIEKQYQERIIAANSREDSLTDKEKDLESRNAELETLLREVRNKTELLTRAEKEIEELKGLIYSNKIKYDQHQAELSELKISSDDLRAVKQELAETRGHLAKVLREGALERQELSEKLSHLSGQGELELKNLKEQNKQLRDSLVLVQEMTDKVTQSLQSQLDKEINKNGELQMKINSLVSRQQIICDKLITRADRDVDLRTLVAKKKSKSMHDIDDTSSSSSEENIKGARRRLERLCEASEKLDANMNRVFTTGTKFVTQFPEPDHQQIFFSTNISHSQPSNVEKIVESPCTAAPYLPSNTLPNFIPYCQRLSPQPKYINKESLFLHNYSGNQISILKNASTHPKLSVTSLREQITKEIEKSDLNLLTKSASVRHQVFFQPVQTQSFISEHKGKGRSELRPFFSDPKGLNRSELTRAQMFSDPVHQVRSAVDDSETHFTNRPSDAHIADHLADQKIFENFKTFSHVDMATKGPSNLHPQFGDEPDLPGSSMYLEFQKPRLGDLKDLEESIDNMESSIRVTTENTNISAILKVETQGDNITNKEGVDTDTNKVKEGSVKTEALEAEGTKNQEVGPVSGGDGKSEINKYMELMSASVGKNSHSSSSSESESGSTESDSSSHDSSDSRTSSKSEKVFEKLEVPPSESNDDEGNGW